MGRCESTFHATYPPSIRMELYGSILMARHCVYTTQLVRIGYPLFKILYDVFFKKPSIYVFMQKQSIQFLKTWNTI